METALGNERTASINQLRIVTLSRPMGTEDSGGTSFGQVFRKK
jgi:hypothetical protein